MNVLRNNFRTILLIQGLTLAAAVVVGALSGGLDAALSAGLGALSLLTATLAGQLILMRMELSTDPKLVLKLAGLELGKLVWGGSLLALCFLIPWIQSLYLIGGFLLMAVTQALAPLFYRKPKNPNTEGQA